MYLTEDGVLKVGYYGLTTQAECYRIKKKDCDGVRILDLEVYEMKSAVWSFETALIEAMGMTPCIEHENDRLPTLNAIAFSHSGCETSSHEIRLGRSTTCP